MLNLYKDKGPYKGDIVLMTGIILLLINEIERGVLATRRCH